LRFSPATAAHLTACPFCAAALQARPAAGAIGYKLIAVDALLGDDPVAEALAVALPRPETEL
jgi:hypothetical protein